MDISDILTLQQCGEETRVQFKERILDKYDIGCEMVALCNSHGGELIIGINDKTGKINPLSYSELQETTNLLGNIASENIVPGILIDIENVSVENGAVVIAHIKEGLNKPYHDNKGIVWVKNGVDKRKVFDNMELAEMMTESANFSPDEAAIKDATIDDLDVNTIKRFLSDKFAKVLENKSYTGDKLKESSLDELCGVIASGTVFRDKVNEADMEGTLLHQFETIMAFFQRNLKNVQIGAEFNTSGVLEIPYVCLVELTVNALVHRSLSWSAPVRIFIFDNRVEIHSPGSLPNGLSVDDIKTGISMPRNNFLFSNAIHLLPYTGAGSGIRRALESGVEMEISNNEKNHELVVTIPRKIGLFDNQEETGSNQEMGRDKCKRKPLATMQKDIRSFCRVPRSAQEIMDRLGVSNQSKNRKKYITPLIEMGILEMTMPDNPNNKNQKYREKL